MQIFESERGTLNKDWFVSEAEAEGNTRGTMKTMAVGQLNDSEMKIVANDYLSCKMQAVCGSLLATYIFKLQW